MMHVLSLCMYCLCVCVCVFSWCICDVLSYYILLLSEYLSRSYLISDHFISIKFEDWTSSKVPEKSLGFPSWMSTISRIAAETAFCTNLGGPRMSTDIAWWFSWKLIFFNYVFYVKWKLQLYEALLNANANWVSLTSRHGTSETSNSHSSPRNRALLDWAWEFWGIRVHPFILRKNLQIWKFSCGTAFSVKSKGVFLAKEPWKIWTPCSFRTATWKS